MRLAALLLTAAVAAALPAQAPHARIAFVADQDRKPGIFVINDDGTDLRRLTTGADSPPVWSPDGCRLVFRRGLDQFYVATLDGKPERLVARTNGDKPENDLRSFFSPDGSRMLIGANDSRFVLDLREEGVADLRGRPDPVFTGYGVAWSPDGKRILFESRNSLHVINADGSGDITLGPGRLGAWTSQGSRVTFLTQEGPGTEPSFAIYKPSGAPVVTMTLPGKMPVVFAMSWNGDASRVALIGTEDDAIASSFSMYVMNADGTGLKQLDNWLPFSRGQSILPRPSWSPDGMRLTFSRAASLPGAMTGPKFDIYTIDADGSHLTQLTHGGNNQTPVWSPTPTCK